MSIPFAIIVVLSAFEVPICPIKGLLGVPCPGCGLTRATEAMLLGDVVTMLEFHPLAPIITPLVIVAIGRAVFVSAGFIDMRSKDPLSYFPTWFWTALGVALIGLWIARMLGYLGGHPDPVDPSSGLLASGGSGFLRALF